MRLKMFKKIVAWSIALLVGYVIIRIVFWLISITFNLVFWLLLIGLVVLVALPIKAAVYKALFKNGD